MRIKYALRDMKRKIGQGWLRIRYILHQLKRRIRGIYRWLFIEPLKPPAHGRARKKVRVITPPRPTIYSPIDTPAFPTHTQTAHKKVRIIPKQGSAKNMPKPSQSKKRETKKKLVVKPSEKRGVKAQLNEIGFFPGPGENNGTFYGVIHSPWGNIDAKVVKRYSRCYELFIKNPPRQAIRGRREMCFNLQVLRGGWHLCHFDDNPIDPISIKNDPVRQIHTVKNYVNGRRR